MLADINVGLALDGGEQMETLDAEDDELEPSESD